MEDFSIGTTCRGEWTIFSVVGDLDVYTAPRLNASLSEAMGQPGVKGVGVDLSRVNFMDSTGLSVILGGHKRAQTSDLGFKLIQPRPQIRRILRLTDLGSLLSIEDERRQAQALTVDTG